MIFELVCTSFDMKLHKSLSPHPFRQMIRISGSIPLIFGYLCFVIPCGWLVVYITLDTSFASIYSFIPDEFIFVDWSNPTDVYAIVRRHSLIIHVMKIKFTNKHILLIVKCAFDLNYSV